MERIKKTQKIVKTQIKNIFLETVNMETQTIYRRNGVVETYPCDFELDKHDLIAGEQVVTQRGTMKTDAQGRCQFQPDAPREHTGVVYEKVFATHHGSVKNYPNSVVFTLTFEKLLGEEYIAQQLNAETSEMTDFIKRGLYAYLIKKGGTK